MEIRIRGRIRVNKDMEFEQIYCEYYLRLVKYVRKKISSMQDAEDIVQDTFAALYRNFDRFDPAKASVSTWVFVAVNNRLKNYYRDRKSAVSLDDADNPIDIADENLIEQAIEFEETRKMLLEAIGRLNEKEQKIVRDTYFAKKASADIGAEMGMSAVNVRVTCSRALKKLLNLLRLMEYPE